MTRNLKKLLVGTLIAAGSLLAVQGLGQDIKFSAIKPVAGQSPVSDEQQGIWAVRTVKASVVDILGLPKDPSQPTVSVGNNDRSSGVSGTGFVIDSSGLVVTNNHVVDDSAFNYFVVLADGTQYPAQILGHDPYDDIALIKISRTGLTAVKMGDSDTLETGQTVFAIGNALGQYQDTVTRGVISGVGRAVNESGDIENVPTTHNWIQTDAAINLGNSGGPLIDMAGEVVGMNTLIDAQGYSLGFAIPINTIKDAVQQLKTFGKVSRPFLGVKFETITPQLLAQKSLPAINGALIVSVNDGTPAFNAGLQANDIVTAVNGVVLSPVDELDMEVQKYQAGTQVTFHIIRGSKELDLPVILGELN